MRKLFALFVIASFATGAAFAASSPNENSAKPSSLNGANLALNSSTTSLKSQASTSDAASSKAANSSTNSAISHNPSGVNPADEMMFATMPKANSSVNSATEADTLKPAQNPKARANAMKATKVNATSRAKRAAQNATAPKKAAKATTSGGGSLKSTKSTKQRIVRKKTSVSTSQRLVKNTEATRGKVTTYGLMPSEFDRLNRDIYHADADAIQGARDTESALRYLPFVTIVNTAGFGQQLDVRAQGRQSANGVKFLINGVSFNPLDSYYGYMPINSIIPNLIQRIDLYPSEGARGGTVNVITSSRSERPYFQVGAGYASNLATTGTSYEAYAQAAENFSGFALNAGAGYLKKGGPREDDETTAYQGVLGARLDFGLGQSLSVDADYFSATNKTTPYNSLWDSSRIQSIIGGTTTMTDTSGRVLIDPRQEATIAGNAVLTNPLKPSKDDRKTNGIGEIETKQDRFVGKLAYDNEINDKLKINLTGFYAFNNIKYDTYNTTTLLYSYFGRYFIGTGTNNMNEIDQSGSSFKESKYGGTLSFDWAHTNGVLVAGVSSIFEKAQRNPIQNLISAAIAQTANSSGTVTVNNNPQWLEVGISTPLDETKWTNAIFFKEKYDFTKEFSLQIGGRYELTSTKLETANDIKIQLYKSLVVQTLPGAGNSYTGSDSIEKSHSNFSVQVVPAYRYSNTGVVYARYQKGANAVPSYAMLERDGGFVFATNSATGETSGITNNFTMRETNLEDEIYNSFEIGFKDYLAAREIYLGSNSLYIDALLFSANVFYIDSTNEFYFEGDPYNGLKYRNYDKSRRYGVEVALEQYFFGGRLGFNESFTYTKAEAKKKAEDLDSGEEAKWEQIPQTFDYKATLGISVALTRAFVNTDLWMQNSFYGKQKVISAAYSGTTSVKQDEWLDPYFISDVGLSFGFNKNAITISAGVKNVFDKLYFDYYNNDKTASIGEYRYLLGQGRTWFVEGVYKY